MTAAPGQARTGNPQANATLILGVVSVGLLIFWFIPGMVSAVACAAPVAGLLAMLAGLRARRAANTTGGWGRNRALAGIGLAAVGLAAFALLLTTSVQGGVQLAQDLSTPHSFEGGGLTLTYPGRWSPLTLQQPQAFCQQPGVECFLTLGSASDQSNINLIRIALNPPLTLQDFDAQAWAQFSAMTPGAALISRDEIEVGGLPAVQRVFTSPASVGDGTATILQVYIVREASLYQMTVYTLSEAALAQHRPDVDAILASITFTE